MTFNQDGMIILSVFIGVSYIICGYIMWDCNRMMKNLNKELAEVGFVDGEWIEDDFNVR